MTDTWLNNWTQKLNALLLNPSICGNLIPPSPRQVMTKDTGYQLEVFNKEEALRYYKSSDSDYNHCRISAYPPYIENHGINRTPVCFLMVDLDLKDFGMGMFQKNFFLEKALKKTKRFSRLIKIWLPYSFNLVRNTLQIMLQIVFIIRKVMFPKNSIHSKFIGSENDWQISIIQKWDGKRPPILPSNTTARKP